MRKIRIPDDLGHLYVVLEAQGRLGETSVLLPLPRRLWTQTLHIYEVRWEIHNGSSLPGAELLESGGTVSWTFADKSIIIGSVSDLRLPMTRTSLYGGRRYEGFYVINTQGAPIALTVKAEGLGGNMVRVILLGSFEVYEEDEDSPST